MIYHLVEESVWNQVKNSYAPESLKHEGFIHFSTAEQIDRTYKRFYHGQSMFLLSVDEARLHAELKYEEADGELFPHLYGALNLDAVVKVEKYIP